MRAFAELLDRLSTTQSRNGKLALLKDYLRSAPDPDRGWALAALTDGLPLRVPLRRSLDVLMADKIDPTLYRLSRDYVGDTAETVALLWPDAARPMDASGANDRGPSLSEIVAALDVPAMHVAPVIGSTLDRLDVRGRWAFLKFIGGAARVGVSSGLAKTAVADAFGLAAGDVLEAWHALSPPYAELFAWAEGRAPRPDATGLPIFRPLMLATPIETADWQTLEPSRVAAEWKWDGIRVQIAATQRALRLYSRTGDDISGAFPEIVAAFSGHDVTLDGELLIVRDGVVAPFNDLQQRLNRKAVTQRQRMTHPAHVRLYDILSAAGEDLRQLPFSARRARLETWFAESAPANADLSTEIAFESFDALASLRADARAAGIEGLMLKRKGSPYLAGRVKGHWYKWKRDALTLDCVLMYAQRGSGKRSSFYSDFTFGVWRGTSAGGRELVPVGKAYSGFTDAELRELDRFVRKSTVDSYGPVRAVEPTLVLEVAFDAVQPSSRHKSGVAMRFPRISRIRWDKPAAEADTIENVLALTGAEPASD